jgi:DNA-binding NarL/FixJ family response regulator
MYIERAAPHAPRLAGETKGTILVIESRMLMRDCIMHVLRAAFPDHEVVDGRDSACAEQAADPLPRLIIIGRYADDPSGAPCELEAMIARFSSTPVVLMAEDDDASLRAAVAAGCRGFVPRSLSLDIAVAAFRLVLVGGTFMPRPIAEPASAALLAGGVSGRHGVAATPAEERTVVAPASPPARMPADAPSFTPREWQIVESLQSGKSNKIIAADLNLSENTVKVHVRHVMRKLRATNRTQAALRSQAAWKASGGAPPTAA